MDEYIKREDALNALLDAMAFTGYQSRAMDAIKYVPTADVAPKSEVEELKANLEVWKQNRFNIFQMLELYKMTEQKVAKEIFAEIDKIFVDYKIDRCLEKRGLRLMVSNGEGIEQRFAELKKKYTGGENNGSKQ